jgi:WD40 repeat protein
MAKRAQDGEDPQTPWGFFRRLFLRTAKRAQDGKEPRGLKLRFRHTLRGHSLWVNCVAWSPDGRTLASGSRDETIGLWDPLSGKRLRVLVGHGSDVYGVAWSPDGRTLASGSRDETIGLWDPLSGKRLRVLVGHGSGVYGVAWSPDGRTLASGSDDKTIGLWDPLSGKRLRMLVGHGSGVYGVAWSPDGRTLASGSADKTIGLWDPHAGQRLRVLEGHAAEVRIVAWSPDGRTLASGSDDKTVGLWEVGTGRRLRTLEGVSENVDGLAFSQDGRLLAARGSSVLLWSCKTWDLVATYPETNGYLLIASLAFHPTEPKLATLGKEARKILVLDVEIDAPFRPDSLATSVQYTNAKIVLVGDTGVGKSGLGLVLSGQPFAPTESTHGRRVWTFDSGEHDLGGGRKEMRESLLWDLAGQPGYRLIHQLHLNEVAVALVVFDGRSEADPLAGVRHWVRALEQARLRQGADTWPLKTFLVAARTDRGGVSISPGRREELLEELGCDGYFETSAREGWNVRDLADAVRGVIDWEALPKVTSTELFRTIKAFLVREKGAGRLLSTSEDLYRALLAAPDASAETAELPAQFATCIGRVEAAGLIRRLSFGDFVLLQPELLDAYASALVNAAKEEPDGLGSIAEAAAREGRFRMPEGERIGDREKEKLLLIATVEDLLRHEIALRESTPDGEHLVFPSQFTREHPELPDPEGQAVVFTFGGPLLSLYATLAVRLSHSGFFRKKDMWQNAAAYTAAGGGSYGIMLREVSEAVGDLTLFFDDGASEEVRFPFEEFVHAHLDRRALPGTLRRRRIFACPNSECAQVFTESQINQWLRRGVKQKTCPFCEEATVSLLDREERLSVARSSKLVEMDRNADTRRDREAAVSVLQGKIATEDFDVFLCHHGADKPSVRTIAHELKERGILPWLDEEQLRPGFPWQVELERQIERIKAAAVFVGKSGIGPWQDQELAAFLRQFVKRQCPVIPVILPDAEQTPKLPVFLEGMMWVDFRPPEPDPMGRLIWGITGRRGLP